MHLVVMGFILVVIDANSADYVQVLDLMGGGDLEFHINCRKSRNYKCFNTETVRFMGACLARGLMYLHQHHIIHRDLKV
tara:strand:- start:160 stop:396 length:237 start_codon:yes stop_codon:yes gene_type:complete